ncbi:phosphotransferase family enzyme [Stackebrandtia albiflava]|uniref:Phosphotransferase family enzyme n=1 Tax=Stackebrandtia albiflava TaxID=406432 RepID=A0A562UQ19_9ACTN|nr:aminoglycoside phosphotransferase family protein [Stackebrandtia albiflava]TWJ07710.1 phosphotransferase family enzyme [Stackebrandtia albiflava]
MTNRRFGLERMRAALADVVAEFGLDGGDSELLYLGNNAVFLLRRAEAVVRITRSTTLHERVRKGVRLARWLESVEAPTVRLADLSPQPVQTGDLLATIWRYIPDSGGISVEDLGRVLRQFHALDPTAVDLPRWDPVGTARRRISDSEALTDEHRRFLLEWCDRLEPEVEALNESTPPRLIHGDAHVGNMLRGPDGEVVLCDFDSSCVGPSGADLATPATAEIWFQRSGMHARLAAAYGRDITSEPDWPVLRQARELTYIAGGAPLLDSSPGIAEEFAHRINSWMNRDTSRPWTPWARLSVSSQP